ncbi:DnaJ family protein [Vibrio ichthyoenteri ATCC 700023]|uniref:DnaJ family protein n=1 Tax=Vibrio ichthyoenteri ATCC 700023 TaxID=870968 RepID=F9S692_9VIBR|nr:DNA-J related domain-containing protein [Vibrio ichthyoenteri]EGU33930.1 DnaJ family protein [Vibrio ichthyoenteri ATCC 700023]
MTEQYGLATLGEVENPLLWPILEILRKKPIGWKVHILAAHLSEKGLMPALDSRPDKDLFKRNFLIMNALYQLQDTLYPERWVQVEAMDIALLPNCHQGRQYEIDLQDPLRDYYTQWSNYEAEEGEIKRLLNEFWTRYREYVGKNTDRTGTLDRVKALRLFELEEGASDSEVRKKWRKLALKWHPDRQSGNSDQFRLICEAWHVLRA